MFSHWPLQKIEERTFPTDFCGTKFLRPCKTRVSQIHQLLLSFCFVEMFLSFTHSNNNALKVCIFPKSNHRSNATLLPLDVSGQDSDTWGAILQKFFSFHIDVNYTTGVLIWNIQCIKICLRRSNKITDTWVCGDKSWCSRSLSIFIKNVSPLKLAVKFVTFEY